MDIVGVMAAYLPVMHVCTAWNSVKLSPLLPLCLDKANGLRHDFLFLLLFNPACGVLKTGLLQPHTSEVQLHSSLSATVV